MPKRSKKAKATAKPAGSKHSESEERRRKSRSNVESKSYGRDQTATKKDGSQTEERVAGKLQETVGIKAGIRRLTELISGKVKGLREKEFRKTLRKRKTLEGTKIMDDNTASRSALKCLITEEEQILAAEWLRWKEIERRLRRLVCLKRLKKKRGESTANAVKRLIGSRTDEQIQQIFLELE